MFFQRRTASLVIMLIVKRLLAIKVFPFVVGNVAENRLIKIDFSRPTAERNENGSLNGLSLVPISK